MADKKKNVFDADIEALVEDVVSRAEETFKLFVVYDPQHQIISDEIFCTDIEKKGRNQVLIIR